MLQYGCGATLYIKSGETSFRLEEDVDYLVLPSNGYLYQVYPERVGEMEENAKKTKMPAIKHHRFQLKSQMFYYVFQLKS